MKWFSLLFVSTLISFNTLAVNIFEPTAREIFLPAWTGEPEHSKLNKKDSAYTELVDSVLFVARELLDTRYASSGTTPMGFDCSGFTRHCFQYIGIALPHNSAAQSKSGVTIKKAEALPGDLIFFKGSNANSKSIGHVGIIVSIEEDEIIFIHAAVKGGVRYDSTNAPYYKRRFVCIKRVIQ